MKLLLENWRNYVLFENIETASRLSIFDFDETIAFTEGHVNVINKITGEEFKTTSQEEYDELRRKMDIGEFMKWERYGKMKQEKYKKKKSLLEV